MNTSPDQRSSPLSRISGKALVAVAFWGASFVFTRIALTSFNPFGIVAFRLAAGTLLLYLFSRLAGRSVLPDAKDRRICVFLAAVLAIHLLMQSYGLQYTSAINTGWIIGFIPVTIAIGSQFLGKQHISRTGWVGVTLGAAGVFCVTMKSPPDFANARLGDMLQILSCLTWTIYTLVAVTPIARNGSLCVTTFCMAIAAGLVALTAAATGVAHAPITLRAALSVAFLGLFCSGLSFYLWFKAVTEHGPARTGALLYLEPFVTVAVAGSVIGETLEANVLLGGVCVLGGVWLVSRGTRPARAMADRA